MNQNRRSLKFKVMLCIPQKVNNLFLFLFLFLFSLSSNKNLHLHQNININLLSCVPQWIFFFLSKPIKYLLLKKNLITDKIHAIKKG